MTQPYFATLPKAELIDALQQAQKFAGQTPGKTSTLTKAKSHADLVAMLQVLVEKHELTIGRAHHCGRSNQIEVLQLANLADPEPTPAAIAEPDEAGCVSFPGLEPEPAEAVVPEAAMTEAGKRARVTLAQSINRKINTGDWRAPKHGPDWVIRLTGKPAPYRADTGMMDRWLILVEHDTVRGYIEAHIQVLGTVVYARVLILDAEKRGLITVTPPSPVGGG